MSEFRKTKTDLISHYPEFLQENLEFNAICDASNPEFDLVWERLRQIELNILPQTADENGIEVYEKWLGLRTNRHQDLDIRRAQVIAKLNETLPYTEIRLQRMLAAIVGWGHFHYERHGALVHIILDETCYSLVFTVMDLLERVLPMNLHYQVSYGMTRKTDINVGSFVCFGQELTLNPYEEHEFETETHKIYTSAHLSMEINKWQ